MFFLNAHKSGILLAIGVTGLSLPFTACANNDRDWNPGNLSDYIVAAGTNASIDVRSTPCVDGEETYSILDLFGNTVYSGKSQSKSCVSHINFNLGKGYYRLNIDGKYKGIFSTPRIDLNDYFGIDAALTHIVKDENLRPQYVSVLSKIGIKNVRERLIWGGLSPAKGNWNGTSGVDNLREEYAHSGIMVLDVIQARLSPNRDFPSPQKMNADFPLFQKKWGGNWIGLEAWNEPNSRGITESLDEQSKETYVKNYVAYMAAARKAIGNGPRFVSGAFAGNVSANADFTGRLSSQPEYFSMDSDFSFHTYGVAESLMKWLPEYSRWLKGKGFKGNIWITESGWQSRDPDLQSINPANITAATQIAAKAIVGYCLGVKHYYAFVLPYYPEKAPNGQYRYFGLTSADGSPNPSLAAYVQAAQVMSSIDRNKLEILQTANGFKAVIPSTDRIVVAVYNNSKATISPPAGIMYAEGVDGRRMNFNKSSFLPGENLVYFYFSANDEPAARKFAHEGAINGTR